MGTKQSTLSSNQQQQQKRVKRSTGSTSGPHQPSATPRNLTAKRPYKQPSFTSEPKPFLDQRSQFNEEACLQWFQHYADPDTPTTISPEGTQRFLEDLGISIEEKMALVIAWKLNVATMGYITQQEWMTGMHQLRVDNKEDLCKRRGAFESELAQDATQFKALYRYTFNYGKNKDQKCMDVDVACALWSVLWGDSFVLVHHFIQFLQEAHPVRVINRDQWNNFYEFITTVSQDLGGLQIEAQEQ
ncbi:hypothetical protein [Absidia glauca]|uniref:Defective in cullin neddylation protein n=1 Tax=Absidia glauca TaxID=4829 RepID=A0A168P800_ABSGL|nr:hypothetical protein [Absidia glauca]